MRSHQYSLGGYYTGIKGWEFSVEGYYKDMYNVLEYKDGVSFFGSSTGWESKVEMGKGRSMGIEFMAQKRSGRQQAGCLIPYPKATANLLKVLSTMESDFHTNMIGAIILI